MPVSRKRKRKNGKPVNGRGQHSHPTSPILIRARVMESHFNVIVEEAKRGITRGSLTPDLKEALLAVVNLYRHAAEFSLWLEENQAWEMMNDADFDEPQSEDEAA